MTTTRTALVALTATLGTFALASPASAEHFQKAWPAKWYPSAADSSAELDAGVDVYVWVQPPSAAHDAGHRAEIQVLSSSYSPR